MDNNGLQWRRRVVVAMWRVTLRYALALGYLWLSISLPVSYYAWTVMHKKKGLVISEEWIQGGE